MTPRYNFSPGPAMLPTAVLERMQEQLLNWRGRGVSVMEVSHRGADFVELITTAEAKLLQLLGWSAQDYRVLFLQGGATTHFSMSAANIAGDKKMAYAITGDWSKKAWFEASRFVDCEIVSTTENQNFSVIGKTHFDLSPEQYAALYYCSNETIRGLRFSPPPQATVPLWLDMSSDILSFELASANIGGVIACAQKNAGIAGLTVVIVRSDFLGRAQPHVPTPLNYTVQAGQNSLSNTPPVFAIYAFDLVLDWVISQGGVAPLEKNNITKANILYQVIDRYPDFYNNKIAAAERSVMNVVFTLPTPELSTRFLELANEHGFLHLKGHASVGGIRASMYNAMPISAATELAQLMQHFYTIS